MAEVPKGRPLTDREQYERVRELEAEVERLRRITNNQATIITEAKNEAYRLSAERDALQDAIHQHHNTGRTWPKGAIRDADKRLWAAADLNPQDDTTP